MAKNTIKNAMDCNVRARENYIKNKTKRKVVSFNVDTEADILEHIEKQDRMEAYIKNLIRKDMNK